MTSYFKFVSFINEFTNRIHSLIVNSCLVMPIWIQITTNISCAVSGCDFVPGCCGLRFSHQTQDCIVCFGMVLDTWNSNCFFLIKSSKKFREMLVYIGEFCYICFRQKPSNYCNFVYHSSSYHQLFLFDDPHNFWSHQWKYYAQIHPSM